MRYDDRLATVLGQPAADARGKAVQWRQLVELLSRGDGEISQDLSDRALARIAHMMKDLPADLLSATSRAIAGRAVPAELVALFAARGAAASAALLTAADLTPAGWRAVRAVAADDVHPLLAAMGHAEPSPPMTSTSAVSSVSVSPPSPIQPTASPQPEDFSPAITLLAESSPQDPPQEDRLSEPVSATTIARAPAPANGAPRLEEVDVIAAPESLDRYPTLPLPSAPQMTTSNGVFRWEAGPTGEIDWVEGIPRSAMIGRSVADIFGDTFAARLPFADAPLTIAEEGLLVGEWRWSGTPAFFPDTGRFAGYRGVARREGTLLETQQQAPAETMPGENDELRELMHELRTPLNAIIGFGEIIEGQYLGPAHRSYRERAAEIVRQARSLSDAVDNLDLAARLRSGRAGKDTLSSLDTVLAVLEEARADAAGREIIFAADSRIREATIALPRLLVDRLVRQFANSITATAVAGERITASLDRVDGKLAIGINRALALRGLSEQQLLADRNHAETHFALRLVQGVAGMIGGRLDIGAERLILHLPLAE